MSTGEREIWIDWMRVVACFLVIMTHSCEPFYLGGEGSLILTKADAIWVSVLNVLPRACVALFIVASSYLQFPLHYSTGEFFRRRAARILVPFLLWTVVYAPAPEFQLCGRAPVVRVHARGRVPDHAAAVAMGGESGEA